MNICNCTLLVADKELSTITTTTARSRKSMRNNQEQEERDIENLFIITNIEHKFERRRRIYGSIFAERTDQIESSESDTISSSSIDQESVPIPNEDRSSIKFHGPGPLKLYLKERFTILPQHHYRKHQQRQMTRRQIPINYGSIHTEQIQTSLKEEKLHREQDDLSSCYLRTMFEGFPKFTSFLSLDPENPILPTIEPTVHRRSSSRLRDMKNRFSKSMRN